jgi:tetratricopeptide (TPR) repeat protein
MEIAAPDLHAGKAQRSNGSADRRTWDAELTDEIRAVNSGTDPVAGTTPCLQLDNAAPGRRRIEPIAVTDTSPVEIGRRQLVQFANDIVTPDEADPLFDKGTPLSVDLPASDSPELPDVVLPLSVRPGMVLNNRYEILKRVQHDGMGVVYQAIDRNRQLAGAAEPWVALKFSRPAIESCTATTQHLRQEFLKLSQLNHPNIVTVYDLAIDCGIEFMVLEWLSGENLADKINQSNGNRIAQKNAIDIVRIVAGALACSHAAGIVHGDVKPSNIFLTDNRTVKLLDFGASGRSPSRACDQIETSWATPVYASCELAEGQTPQPGDDVFALGVTAYYLLSGVRPFGDLNATSAREQGLSPKPLPDYASDYWPAIERALRFSAAERFNNAQEFLDQFVEKADEPLYQGTQPLILPRTRSLAYGALALLVLAAIVVWSILHSGNSRRAFQPLLDSATAALAAGRLVGPGEDNARFFYATVLADAPQNAEALKGLDNIAEQYLLRSRAALASRSFENAVADLNIAREVQPKHFGIPLTADLIGRYREDLLVNAQLASKVNLEQAEDYLSQAALLSDENDVAVARIRNVLEQEKSAATVESLLSGIDQRILSERITVPRGDSAIDLLHQASRLAPGNRQVQVAAEQIVTALLFQAMFAISNGELDAARSFIDSAKALKVKHLALARAEYELARAHSRKVPGPD